MNKNKHIYAAVSCMVLSLIVDGLAFVQPARAEVRSSEHSLPVSATIAPRPDTHTETPAAAPRGEAEGIADKDAIQSLITDQLEAIRERDADMAYALTTGLMHEKFHNAGEYFTAIRFSHRALYNHKSFRFLDQSQNDASNSVQRVEVTFTQGRPAIVIYRLERNPEGAWAIDSFTVVDANEGQDI